MISIRDAAQCVKPNLADPAKFAIGCSKSLHCDSALPFLVVGSPSYAPQREGVAKGCGKGVKGTSSRVFFPQCRLEFKPGHRTLPQSWHLR